MSDKLNTIFKKVKKVALPNDLSERILQKIEMEKARILKRWMVFSFFSWMFSFVGIVFSVMKFGGNLAETHFWDLLSLVYSDFVVVAKNWNGYLFSLLENLPVASLSVCVFFSFVLLVSSNLLWDAYRKLAKRKMNYC